MSEFLEKVYAFCQKHHLFAPGPMVIAVSGGVDSLVLLHVMIALRETLRITPHVATFDHRIRGAASAADVQYVREVAASWGVPVSTGAGDVPARAQEWRIGLEAAARRARYAFLAKVAREIGAAAIATGHNRDDQAETVLMHVIRGAGLAGLRGMAPESRLDNLSLVRPLLDMPRAEIAQYAREQGIIPREDNTNADTAYTRNRLRHEILPLLETLNPGLRGALARLAAIAREDYEALQSAVLPLLKAEGGYIALAQADFRAMLPALQRMVIRLAASRLAPEAEISFELTEEARAMALADHDGGAGVALGEDVWLRVAGGVITIFNERAYPAGCPWLTAGTRLLIGGPGRYTLPGGAWELVVSEPGSSPASEPLSAVFPVPAAASIALRPPVRGDRFRPMGMGGKSQKLSDTLINMKVRAEWRDRLPLLIVNDAIVWCVAPLSDGPRSRRGHCAEIGDATWQFTFREISSLTPRV